MLKKTLKMALIIILGIIIIRAILVMTGFENTEISGDKIALLKFEGTITESNKIIEKLKELKTNKNIKGVILAINSPGGAVTPSNEIYDYILSMDKPVYASMGSVAASGGYMMSIAAEKIYAEPSTITGSIGVIMNMANMEELFNKIGIKSVVIKSGKFKDIGNPDRPMTEEERELLTEVIMDMFDQFVDQVAKRRNMSKEQVLKIADGRIFTGRMAQKAGLVDKLGSSADAFKDMKENFGFKDAELYIVPKDQTWWEKMSASEMLPGKLVGNSGLRPGFYYLADIY